MARKNLFTQALKSALESEEEHRVAEDESSRASRPPAPAEDTASKAPTRSPNVRIFSDSFQEQMLRTLQDIDPAKIRNSRFSDRLDIDEDLSSLRDSIQQNGQQVPALLRRLPDGSFEAVYGRRRILACQQLGIQVRAMVVEINDEDALIAQGLENAARLENSYIERALFVSQILEAGYTNVTVQKALGVAESQASRMRGITRDIPSELIRAIGPAHGIGRRPWEDLRQLLIGGQAPGLTWILKSIDPEIPSPERLHSVIKYIKERGKTKSAPPAPPRSLGAGAFNVTRKGNSLMVTAAKDSPREFLAHLEETLEKLYQEWVDERG